MTAWISESVNFLANAGISPLMPPLTYWLSVKSVDLHFVSRNLENALAAPSSIQTAEARFSIPKEKSLGPGIKPRKDESTD